MLRRALLLFAPTLVLADTRQELIDVFGAMASALSEGNPAVFLRAVDPSMPGYARFAEFYTSYTRTTGKAAGGP